MTTRREFDTVEQGVVNERQGDYGDPLTCHAAIGDVWNAIMCQYMQRHSGVVAFPPELVALMLAGMKLVRLAYSSKPDSFLDAHVYLKFAERFSK